MTRRDKLDLTLLNFLKEVYELTKDDFVYIPLKALAIKHHTTPLRGTVAIENKIILKRKRNAVGGSCEYKWNTIKPNIKMARKINDIMYNRYSNSKTNNLFNQPQEEPTKPQEENVTLPKPKKGTHREDKVEVKQQKEFTLFWGLIKIKY